MNKLSLLLVLVMALSAAAWPAHGKTLYLTEEALKAEARKGFEEILDLWREGNYDALYERTVPSGRQTKEGFANKLAYAPLKPVCCWEKMQDVKITVQDDSRVILRARLGFEGSGATEFKTKSFKLEKEENEWRIAQGDILLLAGTGKKQGRRNKRATKGYTQ